MTPKEKIIGEATDVLRKLIPFITDESVLLQAVGTLMTGTFDICPYFHYENARNPNYLAARVMSWVCCCTEHNVFNTANAVSLRKWVKQANVFLDSNNAL